MKILGNALKIVLTLILISVFITACGWKASEEDINALEETKAAALSAEDSHSKKKSERQKLEADLSAKKAELEKVKAEKEKVMQKLEQKKAEEEQ